MNQNSPQTYRVVNYRDIVTHNPSKSVNGYYHGGNEVWYNKSGMNSYVVCASEASNCSSGIFTLFLSFNDHSIDRYILLNPGYNNNCWNNIPQLI